MNPGSVADDFRRGRVGCETDCERTGMETVIQESRDAPAQSVFRYSRALHSNRLMLSRLIEIGLNKAK